MATGSKKSDLTICNGFPKRNCRKGSKKSLVGLATAVGKALYVAVVKALYKYFSGSSLVFE